MVNEVKALQAPSKKTCDSEEKLIQQWKDRLSQAEKDLDGYKKSLESHEKLATSTN